jgi:hypothetical protein
MIATGNQPQNCQREEEAMPTDDDDEVTSEDKYEEDFEQELRDIIDIESAAANVRPLALAVAGYYNALTLALEPHVAIVLAMAFQNTALLQQPGQNGGGAVGGGA